MRLLNDLEKKVLATALDVEKYHESFGSKSGWLAPNIQFKGWPGIHRYRSKKMGISQAIQFLKRRGYVERADWGFRLTEKGIVAASEAKGQGVNAGIVSCKKCHGAFNAVERYCPGCGWANDAERKGWGDDKWQ